MLKLSSNSRSASQPSTHFHPLSSCSWVQMSPDSEHQNSLSLTCSCFLLQFLLGPPLPLPSEKRSFCLSSSRSLCQHLFIFISVPASSSCCCNFWFTFCYCVIVDNLQKLSMPCQRSCEVQSPSLWNRIVGYSNQSGVRVFAMRPRGILFRF